MLRHQPRSISQLFTILYNLEQFFCAVNSVVHGINKLDVWNNGVLVRKFDREK